MIVGPWADTMLRIGGERIATPACGLVRNDIVFDTVSIYSGASRFQVSMSLRASPQTGVAIRTPASIGCPRPQGEKYPTNGIKMTDPFPGLSFFVILILD